VPGLLLLPRWVFPGSDLFSRLISALPRFGKAHVRIGPEAELLFAAVDPVLHAPEFSA